MAPLTTSDTSSGPSGDLSSTARIIVGLAIFTCALLGMWCVYRNGKTTLCLFRTRRFGAPSSPALAHSRRRSGASSPTSTISYPFKRTSSAKKGAKNDDGSMYSQESIQTPPPTYYRPHSRCPSYERSVPVTSAKHLPTPNSPTLVPPNWPVILKLAGGRPRSNDSIQLAAEVSSERTASPPHIAPVVENAPAMTSDAGFMEEPSKTPTPSRVPRSQLSRFPRNWIVTHRLSDRGGH
ncbi:hypothetical protein C8T65DRAFT_59959 [Cerioporus squamosus]|nr:hypothetical protein C8T65DRAFT_59959 [Cerioporus squamosus]